jgi:hypothetical protein
MRPAMLGDRRVYRCDWRRCWRWVVAEVVERQVWAQVVAELPAMAEVQPDHRAKVLGEHLVVVRLAPVGPVQARLWWSHRVSGGP